MKQYRKQILFGLILLASLTWLIVLFFPDQKLQLTFCDVGQGDAILISQGFSQILIDGGPSDKVLSCLAENMPFWDRTIEVVALSHPEADHLTGLLSVLDQYQVSFFLTGPEGSSSAKYEALKTKLKAKNLKIINPYSGTKIKMGPIILTTLWPEKNWLMAKLGSEEVGRQVLGLQAGSLKLNQFSLVFLLNYKNFQALLMGDADSSVQNNISLPSGLSHLDILKFPHHGSKTGITENFLGRIRPSQAVISVGQNSYGHPTTEALELLKKYKVKVRRTDLEGEIRFQF